MNVAIKALEAAGLLTWVHRIGRTRRRERDLFGKLVTVWQVVRVSNGYSFVDPLERQPGRKGYKSENPTRPQNPIKKNNGARLDGARVIQADPSQASLVPLEPPEIALGGEHGSAGEAKLSATERAAIVARMDAGIATKADWAGWTAAIGASA